MKYFFRVLPSVTNHETSTCVIYEHGQPRKQTTDHLLGPRGRYTITKALDNQNYLRVKALVF